MEQKNGPRLYNVQDSIGQSMRLVNPILKPLEQYQCQECECYGTHDPLVEHRSPLQVSRKDIPSNGGGEYRLSECSAFLEASKRAAMQRSDVQRITRRNGWRPSTPSNAHLWPQNLLTPECTNVIEGSAGGQWLAESSYGTWSDSDTAAAPLRDVTRVMLPAKKCTRCDVGTSGIAGGNVRTPAYYDNQHVWPEKHWSNCEEVTVERHEDMVHPCQTGNTDRTFLLPQSTDMTTSHDEYRDRQFTSGVPRKRHNNRVPRTWHQPNRAFSDLLGRYHRIRERMNIRGVPSEDKTTETEASVPRSRPRQSRPHSAAPRMVHDTNSRWSSSVTNHNTIHTMENVNSFQKTMDHIEQQSCKTREQQSVGIATMERGKRENAELGARGNTAVAADDTIPTMTSQERTPPKIEDDEITGTPSNTTFTKNSLSETLKGIERMLSQQISEMEPTKGVSNSASALGQEKFRRNNEASDRGKHLLRPTIQDVNDSDSQDESVFEVIERKLVKHGWKSISDPTDTPTALQIDAGRHQETTGKPLASDETFELETDSSRGSKGVAMTRVPVEPTRRSFDKDAVLRLDVEKCIKMVLHPKGLGKEQEAESSELTNVEEAKGQVIESPATENKREDLGWDKKIVAAVTDQLVQAPVTRGHSATVTNTTRHPAANSSLSTSFTSEMSSGVSTARNSSANRTSNHERNILRDKVDDRSSVYIHGRREISSVVKSQLKQVRLDVGQLEKLMRFQRFFEEDLTKEVNAVQPE